MPGGAAGQLSTALYCRQAESRVAAGQLPTFILLYRMTESAEDCIKVVDSHALQSAEAAGQFPTALMLLPQSDCRAWKILPVFSRLQTTCFASCKPNHQHQLSTLIDASAPDHCDLSACTT